MNALTFINALVILFYSQNRERAEERGRERVREREREGEREIERETNEPPTCRGRG